MTEGRRVLIFSTFYSSSCNVQYISSLWNWLGYTKYPNVTIYWILYFFSNITYNVEYFFLSKAVRFYRQNSIMKERCSTNKEHVHCSTIRIINLAKVMLCGIAHVLLHPSVPTYDLLMGRINLLGIQCGHVFCSCLNNSENIA